MANIKSQIKRNKQNEKAHQRNKAAKSSLRTSVRKFREAADAGNLDEAGTALAASGPTVIEALVDPSHYSETVYD